MKTKAQQHFQTYTTVIPYLTKDGSEIRELMHPRIHGNKNQSLAEATIPVGGRTQLHKHLSTEEIYQITQGVGLMTLGNQVLEVGPGDTVCISPGTEHCIHNRGSVPLTLLCCCSPPYSHEDTILSETE